MSGRLGHGSSDWLEIPCNCHFLSAKKMEIQVCTVSLPGPQEKWKSKKGHYIPRDFRDSPVIEEAGRPGQKVFMYIHVYVSVSV